MNARERRRPRAAVLAGTLLGLAGANAPLPGCATVCEDYIECSSRAGLRWVKCGDHHEFNDGTSLTSIAEAAEYCYCGAVDLACDDGSTASFCNGSHVGGSAYAMLGQSSETRELGPGAAECLSFDACEVVTSGCTPPLWYLACEHDGTEQFVGLGGTVTTQRATALATCTADANASDGADANAEGSASGDCDYVYECEELVDCYESPACVDESYGDCWYLPECHAYETQAACEADIACGWTPG